MKYNTFLFAVLVLAAGNATAQSVGIGTNNPNSSAMLEVSSANKGLLLPRVALTGINDAVTISNPATSLLVYNTNVALPAGVGYYYNSGTGGAPVWTKFSTASAAGWQLTGNAGTDTATNFIGTTDYKPLKFKVSNQPAGFMDIATSSTFFGSLAGQYHTFANNTNSTGFGHHVMAVHPGALNTAIGAFAMANNESFGAFNSAIGYEALFGNINGQRNAAVGHTSMRSNTSGSANVAMGDSAMVSNTTGSNNTAIGAYSLKSNLTSGSNLAVGYYALENSLSGPNTAIGVFSMRSNTSGNSNTAVGNSSLANNTTGTRNTATGHRALEDNSTGLYNTAMGYAALATNTVGFENTAVGYLALNGNTGGDYNVAIGSYALASGRGNNNTAIGHEALRNDNVSLNNVAIGKSALRAQSFINLGIIYATNNVAVGVEALSSNQPTSSSTGIKNVAIGNYALRDNTTGRNNTTIGHESLANNTTGVWNAVMGVESMLLNTTGSSNVSIGNNSMRANTSGDNNVSVGVAALTSNTTGTDNTAVGLGALNLNTTGHHNTAVGNSAGAFNNANTYCTFLGYQADQTVATNFEASTAIGYNSRITASSQVRIGSTGTGSIGGYQPWSNLSDGRFKRNISEQVKGLDFVMALRPVTYTLDMNQLAAHLQEDVVKDEKGNKVLKTPDAFTKKARDEQSKKIHSGFVAQEVEAAATRLNYEFSGVDKPKNDNDLYALRYAEFVVPLVKAVQEQQQQITTLMKRIEQLETALLQSAKANKTVRQ